MAFDLEIEFVGLCLFVPDPDTRRLRVLAPSTCHGAPPEMEEHVVRLCFDIAYLQPGSTSPSGILALVPVNRQELELTGTPEPNLTLPGELGNIRDVTAQPFRAGVLDGSDPDKHLSARVQATSGWCAGYAKGACWNYPNSTDRQCLCNRLTWAVARDEDRLEWALTALDGGTGRELPVLYPIAEQVEGETVEKIKVALYHTTRDELPPDPAKPGPPAPGTPAHHFAGFYTVYECPWPTVVPTFVGLSCDNVSTGGSPYTCMAAQSSP